LAIPASLRGSKTLFSISISEELLSSKEKDV
jgi:hypothetical protein